jgi:hypothetical protein
MKQEVLEEIKEFSDRFSGKMQTIKSLVALHLLIAKAKDSGITWREVLEDE